MVGYANAKLPVAGLFTLVLTFFKAKEIAFFLLFTFLGADLKPTLKKLFCPADNILSTHVARKFKLIQKFPVILTHRAFSAQYTFIMGSSQGVI